MESKLDRILKNAKENSIGKDKKSEVIKSVRIISKRVLTLLVVISVTATMAACSLGNGKEKVSNPENNNNTEVIQVEEIEYERSNLDFRKISEIRGEVVSEVVVKLLNAGIEYGYKDGSYKTNNIETYKKISNINEEDLIGYYMLLGQEESGKILQILGYEGWDDYLTEKGFVNDENKPDIKMWENSIYEEMQAEYERRMGR